MHLSDEVVRSGHDHAAGPQRRLALDVDPFVPQARDREHGRAVLRGEIVRLLAPSGVLPLVVAGHGNEAAAASERIAKERLLGDAFGSGVERRRLELLEWLAPPTRHQAPTHGREDRLSPALDHRVNHGRRAHVIARLQIRSGRSEPVQFPQLAPSVFSGKAAAHSEYPYSGPGSELQLNPQISTTVLDCFAPSNDGARLY